MPYQKLFFQQYLHDFFHIGAVLPSSGALGRAGAAYLARKQGPARVLEVGAGTGAFTAEIMPLLQPGDTLDVVEINPNLMDVLKQRFSQESRFQRPGVTVNFITDDVRHIAKNQLYDYIVLSLPLTNFSPDLVREILGQMMSQLKPGGVFSYVKYIFISRFKYVFGGAATRAAMQANQQIMQEFADKYQIERRAVLRNIPPTWVYYWQKESTDSIL